MLWKTFMLAWFYILGRFGRVVKSRTEGDFHCRRRFAGEIFIFPSDPFKILILG
jgi:hypothetical protein